MLCQKCQKNQATVSIKQIIDGNSSEMQLCAECAEKENLTSFFIPTADKLFSGFFSDSIFGGNFITEKKVCPLCGSTRSDLASTGRAGCAKCYEVFKDELDKIIYSIHGNARHNALRPGKHLAEAKKQSEIKKLKLEQQKAVEEQNYEKAAEIRDKIRNIEKNMKGD